MSNHSPHTRNRRPITTALVRRDSLLVATLVATILLLLCAFTGNAAQKKQSKSSKSSSNLPADWKKLAAKSQVADFQCVALYTNDMDEVVGARFDHQPSGFILDVLRFETVPQSFLWVNTPPVSDQGEPHTLEHLLLGKGTKGQYVATLEDMSLSESSAFTRQLQTCYHFSAKGGNESFFTLFHEKLDAMLHPTFSDEEIRREVANVGYAIDTDGSLRLEEKGTVYNEMVSSFERPYGNQYFKLDALMYGKGHPQSFNSGGYPAAIRTMQPSDIRNFHSSTHKLSNMCAAVAIPSSIALTELLTKFSTSFKQLEPNSTRQSISPADLWKQMPPISPAASGTVAVESFPASSADEPGTLVMGYPPQGSVTIEEVMLRDLFLDAFSNGAGSNLYQLFVNSTTRTIDVGTSSVFFYADELPGYAVYLGFGDMRSSAVSEQMIDSLRNMIIAEFRKVASYAPGSAELAELNARIESRLLQQRRTSLNVLNEPPGWGSRGTGSGTADLLQRLHVLGGARRDITMTELYDKLGTELKKKENVWAGVIARWKFDSFKPIAVGAKPDVELVARSEAERQQRLASFTENLKSRYGVTDAKAALTSFRTTYDSGTTVIETELAGQKSPEFLSNPPLGIDDLLPYRIDSLPGGKPLVVSSFSNITSATFGLAFDLSVVPESLLIYAAALPSLVNSIGCTKDNKLYSYDEFALARDREVLGLSAYFDMNHRTERCELIVRAAGNDLNESKKALEWMAAVLKSPNLSEANLPRIRDVIQQEFVNQRGRLRGSEESWVNSPVNSYWRQENPLLLITGSFFTRSYALFRLKSQLMEATEPAEKTIFMSTLGGYNELPRMFSKRDSLFAVMSREVADESPMAKQTREDLRMLLGDMPPVQYDRDWIYVVNALAADMEVSATDVLQRLGMVLDLIRRRDNVRGFAILNPSQEKDLLPGLRGIVLDMSSEMSIHHTYKRTSRINQNVQYRYPGTEPVFAGLVNNGTRSGIHFHTADCASFIDNDTARLVDFLTARLYGGGGAHSMFMQTWGAGLAYSNGLRSNESNGRMIYYAERCPDLAQTMQFVVKTLKNAPHDPKLSDYAVSQAFALMRSADDYTSRGERMAADLADGNSPERVAEFRRRVLALRNQPGLYDRLYERMDDVYGLVLPDYGPNGNDAVKQAKAKNLVIGPDTQLDNYEKYLKQVEGPETILFRIYPSDYWLRDLMLIE